MSATWRRTSPCGGIPAATGSFTSTVDLRGSHALLAYDLKTKASRPIFPHESPALVFDWSPDGEHLACVLGVAGAKGSAGPDLGGLWIGRPDADPASWWHVPNSALPAPGRIRSWNTSVPLARHGRPTAGRSPSSRIEQEGLRRTPASRGSGSAGWPIAMWRWSPETRPGSRTCTGRPAAIGSGWYAPAVYRKPWRRRNHRARRS